MIGLRIKFLLLINTQMCYLRCYVLVLAHVAAGNVPELCERSSGAVVICCDA